MLPVEMEPSTFYTNKYEPFTDPRKSDIHYRAAKSKILRSLGSASYRNGSQFAILWISPTGEIADAFASEALQPKLEEWLGKRVQAEAKEMVKAWKEDKERRKRMGEERVEVEGVYGTEGDMFKPDQIDEEMSDGEGIETQKKGSRSTRGGSATSTSTSATRPRPAAEGSKVSSSESIPSSSTRSSHRSTRSIDTAKAQQHASPALSSANSVTSPGPDSSVSFPTNSQNPLTMTREELDRWFTIRLGELSHKTDKILCRSWIREIEPHKQTRFQYQKGDETKPAWWPADIRHKEPDHLGKQERIRLLLHLLRLPQVTITQLEAATAAVQMQIPAHKLPILQNIYEFAKAERRANSASFPGNNEDRTYGMIDENEFSQPPNQPVAETRSSRPQRSTRIKASIGSPNAVDLSMSQQTPRSARASPYPLARSASATNELSNLTLNSATSPSLAHSPASTSLSRSQSYAGLNASTSTARAPRLSGRASIGEGDLQATPYQGGRVRTSITPRQAASQGSPLSSSMGRSASTSAIGAKTMMDDSVASPAMIKSRSKLSQKCFEQMGAGAIEMGGGGGGGGGGRLDFVGSAGYGQFPQPQFAMIHPDHLQSMRSHPEGFPPPPPSVPGQQQHHLVTRHPRSHAAPRQDSQPHPQHSQVQVQVQVHAGHGLPIPPQPQHFAYAHPASQQFSNSPMPNQSSHFSPNPQQPVQHSQQQQQQQQPMHFIAPNGLVYEHGPPALLSHQGEEVPAYYASAKATPNLSSYINSPELGQHSFGIGEGHEYLMLPGNNEAGLAGGGGGGGGGSDQFDSNAYLNSSSFTPNLGGGDADLGAYVRQLEGFEQQAQQQQQGGGFEVGLGFEHANGQHDLSNYVGGNEEYYY